jgi:hypothetical protein
LQTAQAKGILRRLPSSTTHPYADLLRQSFEVLSQSAAEAGKQGSSIADVALRTQHKPRQPEYAHNVALLSRHSPLQKTSPRRHATLSPNALDAPLDASLKSLEQVGSPIQGKQAPHMSEADHQPATYTAGKLPTVSNLSGAVSFGKTSRERESMLQNVDVSLELEHYGPFLGSTQSKAVDHGHVQRNGFERERTVPSPAQDNGVIDIDNNSSTGNDSSAKVAKDQARKKLSSHRCEDLGSGRPVTTVLTCTHRGLQA